MPMTVSELQVKVSADTSAAETGLASFGSKVGSAGSAMATAFGAAAIGGIAAVGAGLAASVSAAATFESSMSAIKAVTGATAPEMEQLSALALKLGADTSFSASEAADGIGELVKAGVSIGDVMGGGAAAALNLAAAGGLSVAESAEIASNAMNVFSLKGADVGHVADVIAGAANASAIDVHDFGLSLAASGSVAATVGVGFDDLGTAIAVMGQSGIKGADAGTSLKTMLLNLTPASKAQIAVSKELGITTADGANKFFDASGKAKSMAEIADVLKTSTAGLTEQQKLQALQTLFGTDAIRAAAIMAKAGAEGFNTMAESIGKVTAADVAKTRLDNLKGSIEQLKGSLETAGIQLGTMLLPGLKTMVDGLTEWVNKGIGIIEMLPDAWADLKTTLATGTTGDAFGELLSQLGLSDDTVFAAITSMKNIGDSWRTMQQVFANNWSPSDQIDPFVNSVGIATTKVRDLGQALQDNGSVKAFKVLLLDIPDVAGQSAINLGKMADSLARLGGAATGAGDGLKGTALAIKAVAVAVDLAVLNADLLITSFTTVVRVLADSGLAMIGMGKAVLGLVTNNQALKESAARDIVGALTDTIGAAQDWRTEFVTVTGRGFADFGDLVRTGSTQAAVEHKRALDSMVSAEEDSMGSMSVAAHAGMDGVSSAVESGASTAVAATQEMGTGMTGAIESAGPQMVAAADTAATGVTTAMETQAPATVAAVETMGTGMATALENAAPQMIAAADTGAAGVVTAVDGQAPAAGAAATAMGDGMAAGIQAAGPAMASAAEGAASGAVAAVQGQEGAASAAGQGVGDALGSGMQGGILGWVGSIASAAAQLVSAALGAAHEEADAHSPSRKTEKLGEDLAEGLEIGLNKSSVGDEMRAKIRDFIQASRDYIPVGGEIKRVDSEIKVIRDQAQTDYLFRAKEMITVDSEALRLKSDMVSKERDLLPLRQDIARATRDIADIERGDLTTRTAAIQLGAAHAEQQIKINEYEREKIPLQQRALELDRALLNVDPDSKRAKQLKEEQDEIRKKTDLIDNTIRSIQLESRAQDIDADTSKNLTVVASAGAKIRKEELDDRALLQQRAIDDVKAEIDILGGEQSVFAANEAVIKNATQNEIDYRSRLIAVFTAEGKPLADRISSGLALVDQLENEGKISHELADKLRDVAKESGAGAEKTAGLGSAAATAAPQIDAAAQKAEEMAKQAKEIAEHAGDASGKVDALSKSLGKLPDWFHPKGSSSGSLFDFGGGRADGGPVTAGTSYLVGERGVPEMFTPSRSGTIVPLLPSASGGGAGDTVVIDMRGAQVYDGSKFEDLLVRGLDRAQRRGRIVRVTR